MCRPPALSAWADELQSAFPHLTRPQVKVLAQYSLGMALAGRSGLSCVAAALAAWVGQAVGTVRERVRDWYRGAADKSGGGGTSKRRELDVDACFAPLLSWVLRDWAGDELALALDATTLGDRFVVLAVAVEGRAGAVPVAWAVLPAAAEGSWRPHWLALLGRLKDAVPAGVRRVVVAADRGLYAKWLFEAVVGLGWHPLFRVNAGDATFTPAGGAAVPLGSVVPRVGDAYAAAGVAFASPKARLPCTLLARHDAGYADPWLVLTDLPPGGADVAWYGLRAWVERGFRHAKSGGWDWQATRMTDPARASRLWLAMAVATVLLTRHGADDEPVPAPVPVPVPPTPPTTTTTGNLPPPALTPGGPPGPRPAGRRTLSVFRTGLLLVQAALLAGTPLARGRFVPEPWPRSNPPAATTTMQNQPP